MHLKPPPPLQQQLQPPPPPLTTTPAANHTTPTSASSCDLWASIVEASQAYARRRMADFRRLERTSRQAAIGGSANSKAAYADQRLHAAAPTPKPDRPESNNIDSLESKLAPPAGQLSYQPTGVSIFRTCLGEPCRGGPPLSALSRRRRQADAASGKSYWLASQRGQLSAEVQAEVEVTRRERRQATLTAHRHRGSNSVEYLETEPPAPSSAGQMWQWQHLTTGQEAAGGEAIRRRRRRRRAPPTQKLALESEKVAPLPSPSWEPVQSKSADFNQYDELAADGLMPFNGRLRSRKPDRQLTVARAGRRTINGGHQSFASDWPPSTGPRGATGSWNTALPGQTSGSEAARLRGRITDQAFRRPRPPSTATQPIESGQTPKLAAPAGNLGGDLDELAAQSELVQSSTQSVTPSAARHGTQQNDEARQNYQNDYQDDPEEPQNPQSSANDVQQDDKYLSTHPLIDITSSNRRVGLATTSSLLVSNGAGKRNPSTESAKGRDEISFDGSHQSIDYTRHHNTVVGEATTSTTIGSQKAPQTTQSSPPGPSQLSAANSKPSGPQSGVSLAYPFEKYDSELDDSLMWRASQYLYMHMRAQAASSIFGLEVDVEWSNERTNSSSISLDDGGLDDLDDSSAGAADKSKSKSLSADGFAAVVKARDSVPFATIDVVSGQSLYLQCTAQAMGRLPEVKWYKRVSYIPTRLKSRAIKIARKIGHDLYWPLSQLDLFKGADDDYGEVDDDDKASKSFVCSESTTIFDNLDNQTFTVVSNMQLSQYNDIDETQQAIKSKPLSMHQDFNIYACIVDADVRHNYATLGVRLRKAIAKLPLETSKRLIARSALKSGQEALTGVRSQPDFINHQAYSNINLFRQSLIELPMNSHWVPIINGSSNVDHKSLKKYPFAVTILSIITMVVFSSLLALVYLTLRSYRALTELQIKEDVGTHLVVSTDHDYDYVTAMHDISEDGDNFIAGVDFGRAKCSCQLKTDLNQAGCFLPCRSKAELSLYQTQFGSPSTCQQQQEQAATYNSLDDDDTQQLHSTVDKTIFTQLARDFYGTNQQFEPSTGGKQPDILYSQQHQHLVSEWCQNEQIMNRITTCGCHSSDHTRINMVENPLDNRQIYD